MRGGAWTCAGWLAALTVLLLPRAGARAVELDGQEQVSRELTGPYLGQTPPVNEPALFAPGMVSLSDNHSSVAISPDGSEMYWDAGNKIWFTRLEGGSWTESEVVPFCRGDSHLYGNPFISPDAAKMFFTSFRPGAVSHDKENIWYVERTPSGWSDPKPVSPAVNEMALHWSVSVSDSGTLCFQGSREDSRGGLGDIYCSQRVKGVYTRPLNMGPAINTRHTETCPYIAPDESYIIFNRFDQEDMRNSGILISYRDRSGDWLPAVTVLGGSPDRGGVSPRISPDGKYLFFANRGVWWMPAGFVEELRPKR